MARPTVAEIDLDALRHNFRAIASRIPPSTAIFAVVKADAYGHGAVPAARALEAEGARWFGVATVEEGIELRAAGIRAPLVVLGGIDEPQAGEAHAHGLSGALFEEGQVGYLSRAAREAGRPFPVHVKIDTGMGRLGFLAGRSERILDAVASCRDLRVEGFMTHLSSADGREPADREYTRAQLSTFAGMVPRARALFGPSVTVHALNSAGIVEYGEHAHDAVRPGITLYGCRPADGVAGELPLRPVMRLASRIVSLKEVPAGHPVSYARTYCRPEPRRIAAVPVGYADGYRRTFSGAAWMGIRGGRARVAGRVCMDHTMIDVTEVPGAAVGDEVVLLGPGGPSAEELAALAGTIPYEILTQVGRRIPRRALG